MSKQAWTLLPMGIGKDEQDVPQWLIDMPKNELHRHLGGSLRLDTILDLASDNSVELPILDGSGKTVKVKDVDDLANHVVYKEREEKNLKSYLDCITICEAVLTTPESFQRAAYEVVEDVAKENGKLLELRFGPTNYVNGNQRLPEIVEAVLDGLKKGEEEFGVKTGLIICGIRTSYEATQKAVEMAVNYQGFGVVGFDLAGMEKGYRPVKFKKIIEPVIDNFVPVTIHAGENDTVASIAEAVKYLHAVRIGHGISIRESPKLLEYFDRGRRPIEVCFTSNGDTGAVYSLESHPARVYYMRGLRLAICTDNPTISNTNLTNESMQLMKVLGFKKDEIMKMTRDGFKSAFTSNAIKRELIHEFDEYAAQHGVMFGHCYHNGE